MTSSRATLALSSCLASGLAALALGCHARPDRPPLDDTPPPVTTGTTARDAGADAATDGGAPSADASTPLVLARILQRPQGLALSGGSAVITADDDDAGAAPTGTVLRLARAAPSTPTMLAGGQSAPFAIAISPSAIVWTNRGTAQADGALMILAPGAPAPRAVAQGETLAAGVAVDATYAYWTSSLGGGGLLLERATLAGGAPDTLATLAGAIDPAGVAVDGAYAYFVGSGTDAAVLRVLTSGGPPETLLSAPGARFVDIAVVGDTLYVTDAAGSVLALPAAGGASRVVASAQASPSRLAHDASRVYWTNEAADGAIMAVAIAGGAPVTLAAHLDYPRAIAVDDAIYFTTRDAVMRLAK